MALSFTKLAAAVWVNATAVNKADTRQWGLDVETLLTDLDSRHSGEIFKALYSDDTGGSNGTTAQPWFPTAGGVTVAASTTYFFDGQLYLSRAAGTTSHSTSLLFGGTATLTSIWYQVLASTGDANSLAAADLVRGTAATALSVKSASTSATEQAYFEVRGIVRVNGGGTFIPQFKYDVAPGGAPTAKAGSYFRMNQTAVNATATRGTWA